MRYMYIQRRPKIIPFPSQGKWDLEVVWVRLHCYFYLQSSFMTMLLFLITETKFILLLNIKIVHLLSVFSCRALKVFQLTRTTLDRPTSGLIWSSPNAQLSQALLAAILIWRLQRGKHDKINTHHAGICWPAGYPAVPQDPGYGGYHLVGVNYERAGATEKLKPLLMASCSPP